MIGRDHKKNLVAVLETLKEDKISLRKNIITM